MERFHAGIGAFILVCTLALVAVVSMSVADLDKGESRPIPIENRPH